LLVFSSLNGATLGVLSAQKTHECDGNILFVKQSLSSGGCGQDTGNLFSVGTAIPIDPIMRFTDNGVVICTSSNVAGNI